MRLVAGFPPRRPGFASGQHVEFVVDIAALGQVFSEYFGFPCQSFHKFLHHHNHPGWHNRPFSGRSAEWSQLDPTPHYTNLSGLISFAQSYKISLIEFKYVFSNTTCHLIVYYGLCVSARIPAVLTGISLFSSALQTN
jgi:hypothetical protein